MAVDVVTEFGANTKKFDAVVEKSSKKAQKNLENIGKGARVAGGAMGELVEKFNNLATGGKLGLVAAGVGLIAMAIKKAVDISHGLFKGAAEDARAMVNDVKEINQINSQFINDSEGSRNILREAIGKKQLSHRDMQKINAAIDLLEKREGISGLSIKDRQLVGYTPEMDMRLSKSIIQAKLDANEREIRGNINSINVNNQAVNDFKGNFRSAKGFFNKILYAVGHNDQDIKDINNQSNQAANEVRRLEMQRRKLKEEAAQIGFVSAALFKDAEEEAAKDTGKADVEARKKLLKELTEKRAGISFLAGGSSQMFTNSLTSRGGWAGGGKIWDTNRFQQQILQYNAQQQATLLDIEKQIEELQRI